MRWENNFRIKLFPSLLFLGILVLLARLFFLQIIKGEEYRSLADSNRLKKEVIHAPRGIIFDRNGYPLVRNIPGFRMVKEGKIKVVSREEALRSEIEGREKPEVATLREYLYSQEFAHALGYLGEISEEELERPEYQKNRIGDLIGKTGLEEKYNSLLSGVDGARIVEVDASLVEKRMLGEVKPRPGQDLKTTLDLPLQKRAFSALKDVEKGVIVATDPRTGEVLALVSKPSFDPNFFTLGKKEPGGEEVLSNKGRPLFNRAISGTYPPGSTFKIVTAAAGLEEGVINKDSKIEDVGILRVGRFSFPNWYFIQYGKLEGFLDVVGALRRSNDIFFYKVAEMVGLEKLGRMAKEFGVGDTLGIDLAGEAAGLFPTEEWKMKNIGDRWYLGDTYHLGIGQGYLLVTPLQVNAWTAVIASGGTLYQPQLLKNSKFAFRQETRSRRAIRNSKFLSEQTISLIREGMRQACSPGGTGWPLFKFRVQNSELRIDNRNFFLPEEATVSGKADGWVGIPVACKTGTAEFGDPAKGRTHAWFTVFAPVEDPQIAVTVLVEGGGEGSNVAAPIAKKVLEEWFSR